MMDLETFLDSLKTLPARISSMQNVAEIIAEVTSTLNPLDNLIINDPLQIPQDLRILKYGQLRYVKDLEVEIVHPYISKESEEEEKIEHEMIKVKWEGEVRDGVPHGLGYVKYEC